MDKFKARGALLETLRLARGLTQANLETLTRIPQATLSKAESGDLDLELERWSALATALAVPVSAFLEVENEIQPARIFHRKQRTTPKSAVQKVGADASLMQQRMRALIQQPGVAFERRDLEGGFVTPQELARDIRAELGLGLDPIADLTALIEKIGAVVIYWPLESLQVDAIATWPDDSVPVMLVADHVGPERQRFTLAHELGHALMHEVEATDAQERQADEFAAELLVPAAQLRDEWPVSLDLSSLIALKRRWRISLAAILRRGYDLGLVSEEEYRAWNITLATSGMHRREPEPIEPEAPQRLAAAIKHHLSEGLSIDDLAARSHMYPEEFKTIFMEMEHIA